MLKEEQTQTNQKAWISTLPTFSCLIVFKRLFHFRKVLFFYFLLFLLYIIIHQFYLCIKTQASLWQKLYEHNKASFVLKHIVHIEMGVMPPLSVMEILLLKCKTDLVLSSV